MKPSKSTQDKNNAGISPDNVVYDFFAPYYDHYMRHVDYDLWVDKIQTLQAFHSRHKPVDVLELACGTAQISERLVKTGYTVTASDRSAEMLNYAGRKEFKPNLLQADMTDALPIESFDLVLLVFDSINYLLEKSSVAKMLENVYATLRSGGLFIFDISTYRNSKENFNEYLNLDEENDYVLIHRADFDSENRMQNTHLTIFQKSDNHYIRMDEHHKQRIYYVSELLSLCESSPLKCEGIYSLYQDKNLIHVSSRKLDHQYSRLFFVLKKRVIDA